MAGSLITSKTRLYTLEILNDVRIPKPYYPNNDLLTNLTYAAGFKLLRERVAPSAFHNSAQRNDPPRCHPNTRVQILQDMFNWILQRDDRETWLLWLNGAAGAGKSAIMQTLAERCVNELIAIASFFFFRGDATRNSVGPLIATLVYQLILSIPETEEGILRTIERNPLIFDQTLESQLRQLLINPLLSLPPHLHRTFAIFIDGLDECEGEHNHATLIKLFGAIQQSNTNFPIIFLLGSRRELQIEAAFMQNPVSQVLCTIPLDKSDIEKTSNDIRQFLTDKFKEIKTGHPRRDRLPPDWPPVSRVEEIVTKSSGQFIYASVVINYVSLPRYNPARQLDIIHDINL
ncbi:hypothetical protein BDN70DRAFT_985013 [Pholiota conissans]|uniref:NACHT domain-containing protein n=1 Tax=Pholiota conissans TaxID=109636 RepID=A0A9P5YKN1_9AGAR|nr:hypothetical protein BDN70DRAFT_985013 [Pholiota conissans]